MTDVKALSDLYKGMGATPREPARNTLRDTARAYLATCYPLELLGRLFAGGSGSVGWRHLARQSLFGYWEHAPFIHRPSPDGLQDFLVDAPTRGAFDAWVSAHVGALVREAVPGPGPSADIERELVLDLDLNAWDTARSPGIRAGLLCTCANDVADGKTSCRRCFCLVELADVVFEHVLLRPLFNDAAVLMWVYSGGKGAHAWIGHRDARTLDAGARKRLLDEFTAWQDARFLDRLAASSLPFLEPLLEAWRTIIVERERVFESSAARQWLGRFLAIPASSSSGGNSSEDFWKAIEAANPRQAVMRAVLEVAMPIVDLELLRGTSHLAKTPFSMHASNANIALPLARERLRAGRFDPRKDAVRVSPEATALPLFQEGVAELERWLHVCEHT